MCPKYNGDSWSCCLNKIPAFTILYNDRIIFRNFLCCEKKRIFTSFSKNKFIIREKYRKILLRKYFHFKVARDFCLVWNIFSFIFSLEMSFKFRNFLLIFQTRENLFHFNVAFKTDTCWDAQEFEMKKLYNMGGNEYSWHFSC